MLITRHRGAAALTLAIFSTLGLTACGAGDSDASSAADDLKVTVDAAAAAKLPSEFKDGISFASDAHSPPMEFFDEDNHLQGFDYDLMQAIGAKLGVKVTMNDQPWDGIIASLQAKKYDAIISGMNDTPEREKVLDFVDYFRGGFGILVQQDNPARISTATDLCGKTVAVQKASAQDQVLAEMSKRDCPASSPITVQTYPTETDAQNALRAGKTEAEVLDGFTAVYAAKTAGGGNYFDLVHDAKNPAGLQPLYTGIGLLKGNAGLRDALLAALQSLIDDGNYQKLLDKWGLDTFGLKQAGINLATKNGRS